MKARARSCGCHSHNGLLLSPEGLAQRKDSLVGPLAVEYTRLYLDKVGSVSGLRRDEATMIFDDGVIDEQFQRNFLQKEGT